jgi:hypothetical protein
MKLPEGKIVVLDIAGKRAILVRDGSAEDPRLLQLGFTLHEGQLQRPINDSADREKLINDLIDLGALFSTGRDWSPAELVEFYREQGKVATSYLRITWTAPDQYEIFEA